MCFSRTCLEKELPNESCYVLKHAFVHKCRELQSRSREDQSTKPSSEFAFFFLCSHFHVFYYTGNTSQWVPAVAVLLAAFSQAEIGSSTMRTSRVALCLKAGGGEEDHQRIQQRFLFTGHNVSKLVLKGDTVYTQLSLVSGYF